MSRYTAVLFDLFDTLVRFDRNRLPEIVIDGRAIRSTAGRIHAIVHAHAPSITLEDCYRALIASWHEAERQRAVEHREVPALARFEDFFRRLSLLRGGYPPELGLEVVEAHGVALSGAAEFPAHHARLVRRLARRYRLAVVSNFDYAPTAIGLLEREGVADLFGAIIVSDVIGWRKPRREIFDAALERLDARAEDALFVGDRPEIDVAGARAVGMDAAWLNPEAAPLPEGVPAPTFEIRDLGELGPLLLEGR